MDSFFEGLTMYWNVIIAVVAIIGFAVRIEMRVRSVEQDAKRSREDSEKALNGFTTRLAAVEKVTQTVREDISSIKTSVEHTGHNISDIRRVLERLDERLHK